VREYKYSLSVTSQFYFCGIPFRLDTTPKCDLGCLYCFAMSKGGRKTSQYQIANPLTIRRKLDRAFSMHPARLDIAGQMLRHRVPIHFGGVSDPFCSPTTSQASRRLLKHLAEHNYPTIISTKQTDELTKESTLSALQCMANLAVQISFSVLEPELTSKIEPLVPSPCDRLRAVKTLTDLGIPVIIRLQPLLPEMTRHAEKTLIPAVAEAGARHVIVEFLKIPVEKNVSWIDQLYIETGHRYDELYHRMGARLVGREWLLPNEYKWEALQPLIYAIHQSGMTYGAGDYAIHHLGDTRCCCGIDDLPGFRNWFQGNFANVIRESPDEHIGFDQLRSHWFPDKSIRRILNSNSRIDQKTAMLEYLQVKWNSPGTTNAPDAFLGVTWKGEYDDQENCVYRKEKPLT